MQKEAYRPTIGPTPTISEKEIDSGMRARATVMPASISPRMLENHDFFSFSSKAKKPP
jgi:hypothetical protein